MLPWIFHWHDASKQAPLPGEARLLWFANGNTPGGADDNEEDPDEKKNAPTNKFDEEIGKAADEFAQKMKEAFIKHHPSNQNPNTPSTPGTTTIDVDQAIPAEQPAASDQPAAPAVPTQPQDPNTVPGSTVIDADPSGVRETAPQGIEDDEAEATATQNRTVTETEDAQREEGEEGVTVEGVNVLTMRNKAKKIHDDAIGQYQRLKIWQDRARAIMRPEQYRMYEEILNGLENIQQLSGIWTNFYEWMNFWGTGDMSPQELLNNTHELDTPPSTVLGRYSSEPAVTFKEKLRTVIMETRGNSPNGEIPDLTKINWDERMNHTSKQTIIDFINRNTGLRDMLLYANESLEQFERLLYGEDGQGGSLMTYTQEAEQKLGDAGIGEDIAMGGKKGLFTSLKELTGIEFYTINDIISAWTQFKEAFQQTRSQRTRQKGAALAKQFGPFVKWLAPDINDVLEMNYLNKNNEVKDGIKGRLNNNANTFKELFDAGGIFDMNNDDFIHNMAVLEYAAGHGWLYGLYEEKGVPPSKRKILGRSNWTLEKLLPGWGEDGWEKYYIYLLQENRKGEGQEAETAKGREQATTKTDQFIDAIDVELSKMNLWGAKGIMERAFERGLTSTMSARIAATFLRHLRTNAELRQYISPILLDQIGIIAIYTPAPTLGLFKVHKDEIVRWAKSGSEDISSFQLGSLVERIEKEIKTKDPDYYNKLQQATEEVSKGNITDANMKLIHEKDALIAKFLATQTVVLPNKKVMTIFSHEYDDYNKGSGEQGTIKIDQADEDYYREQSEILLSDKIVIDQILQTTTNGDFIDKSRAGYFIKQIISAYDDFFRKAEAYPEQRSALHAAAKNYKMMIQDKLNEWLKAKMRTDRTAISAELLPKEKDDAYAIKALLEKGLIDRSETIDKSDSQLAKVLKQQLDGIPVAPQPSDERPTRRNNADTPNQQQAL